MHDWNRNWIEFSPIIILVKVKLWYFDCWILLFFFKAQIKKSHSFGPNSTSNQHFNKRHPHAGKFMIDNRYCYYGESLKKKKHFLYYFKISHLFNFTKNRKQFFNWKIYIFTFIPHAYFGAFCGFFLDLFVFVPDKSHLSNRKIFSKIVSFSSSHIFVWWFNSPIGNKKR